MSTSSELSSPPAVSPLRLAALAVIGLASALWALFQWGELLLARAGGTPFCALGDTFNCAQVWDSPLAIAVHNATQIPVAGWGLVWGLAAAVLPIVALVDVGAARRRGLITAIVIVAGAGVLTIVGLAVASFLAGALCIGCLATYAVVVVFAAAALPLRTFDEPQKGLLWSGGFVVGGFLLLLVPGMRTPHALSAVNADAMKAAADAAGKSGTTDGQQPDKLPDMVAQPGPFDGPSTGDEQRDAALQAFMAEMPPAALQMMSNYLADYDKEPKVEMPAARVVYGSKDAPVRLVDWTDPLCPHCAELHSVIDEIKKVVPDGTLAVEPHHFPLDKQCNPHMNRQRETDVVCRAVRAELCLENEPQKLALAQKLIFENQNGLTPERLAEVLAPVVDIKSLEACAKSADTQKKLDADIDAANKLGLEGTPLLYLNGKKLPPLPPLVYALVLTHGQTKNAAFKALPPPKAGPAPAP